MFPTLNINRPEDGKPANSNMLNAGVQVDIPRSTIFTIGATVIVCAMLIVALSFLSAYLKKNLL